MFILGAAKYILIFASPSPPKVGRSVGPPRVTCRRAGGAQVGRSVGRFRLKNSLRCTRQTVGRTAPTQIFRRAAHGQWVGRSGQIPIVPVSCGAPPTRSPVATVPRSTLIAQSHCTEAVCDARWSIRRLSEHHTVSWDVCAKTSHIQQSLRLLRLHVHTIMLSAGTGPESATRNGIHCTEAVCDARVGRSDGCLSTTQCHVMCVQKQRDRELNPGAKGQHVNKLAQ